MKLNTLQEIKHEITSTKMMKYSSDEEWQEKFNLIKLKVSPSLTDKKMRSKFIKESGIWNEELYGTYRGGTNWSYYCHYINDVLKQIRNGKIEHCYYVHQICNLLKYEHDTLKTKYIVTEGCCEVWLESKNKK